MPISVNKLAFSLLSFAKYFRDLFDQVSFFVKLLNLLYDVRRQPWPKSLFQRLSNGDLLRHKIDWLIGLAAIPVLLSTATGATGVLRWLFSGHE